ncbi:MAG: RnfH family protein [Gammaproteobacteria bacterium]
MSIDPETITVEVAPRPPLFAGLVGLRLPTGACVADALVALGIDAETGRLGIWGREVTLATVLAEGDRIEFYRPLVVDPKTARRARVRR